MDKRYYEPEVSVHFLSVEGGFGKHDRNKQGHKQLFA